MCVCICVIVSNTAGCVPWQNSGTDLSAYVCVYLCYC